MKKRLIFIVFCMVLIPSVAVARVGVGVTAGKIKVDEPIKPGGIYGLPIVPVVNTGDELSDYGFSIEYLEYQEERKPPREWFRFDPEKYSLSPGKVQDIKVKLMLPVNAQPGEYFAFLEAHPVVNSEGGGETTVKIAAASKLYFEVAPANIWQGMYYRFISLINQYSPWTYIVAVVMGALIVFSLIRRFFTFKLSVSRRSNSSDG